MITGRAGRSKPISSKEGPHGADPALRKAFDLLFALLRRIDADPDSVVFFADEAGSWQVGVDWRTALAAYFRCLADETPAEEYAREVDRVIEDFADHERPRHLPAARRAANAEQDSVAHELIVLSQTG